MRLPDGFGQDRLVLLHKALYGLRQAPLAWYKRLRDFLVSGGFSVSSTDPCIFLKNENGKEIIVCVYVDDLLIVSDSDTLEIQLKGMLKKEFTMKDLGPLVNFLGITFQNNQDGSVILHQRDYSEKLVTKFSSHITREFATPLPSDLTPSSNMDMSNQGWDADLYRSAVGGLMWLMVATRPDLAFAVGWLARFVASPLPFHYQMLSRVLGYLSRTRGLGLIYRRHKTAVLRGDADADWATDPLTRKSVSAYLFYLGGSLVSWCSKKQKCVALSSCEAEFVSLSEAVRECLWLRRLIQDIFPSGLEGATSIGQDNQAAIATVKSTTVSQRNKHIALKYFFCRQAVLDKLIVPLYVPTLDMPADLLTKSLPRSLFEQHVASLGMVECAF